MHLEDRPLCPECAGPMPERGPTGRRRNSTAVYCSAGSGSCKERVLQRRRYHRRKNTRPDEYARVMARQRTLRRDWETRQRDAGKCVRCADGVPFAGALCDACRHQMGRLPV